MPDALILADIGKLAMLHPLTEWKIGFLRGRDLVRPSGAPLYSYRMNTEEFEQLKLLLRQRINAYMQSASLTDIAERVSAFPALFVLHAAEWWHRRYDGSGWSWEPIMADLGLTASDWGPSQRGACIEKGLQDWGLQVSNSNGLRYLGSIAFQGGLPMELLASARGSIGRVLGRVLRLAATGGVDAKDVQDWVRSLATELPRAYRQSEIYVLLAEVIICVLRLKEAAKLTGPDGAIAALDRHDKNWRNRFPVPMEDVHAQRLIEQLMRDAASVSAIRSVQKFAIERRIEPRDDGNWELRSDIVLPEYIDEKNLAVLFGVDEADLTRLMILRFSRASHVAETEVRRIAGHDRYRISRQPLDIRHEAAAAEHLMTLVTHAGTTTMGAVNRGFQLDTKVPWIFEPAADAIGSFRFACLGSCSVAASSALLCVPTNWIVRPEAGGSASPAGELINFSRLLWAVSGTIRIEDPIGPYFRVRCGSLDATEFTLGWRGTRMWQQFDRPAMAFCGTPTLYQFSDDGLEKPVQGPVAWRIRGGPRVGSTAAVYGPVDALWPADGETKWRSSIVLLPGKADFVVEPGESPECGSLRFINWKLLTASINASDVHARIEKVGDDVLMHMTYHGSGNPPEWCELRSVWPGNPNEVLLTVPFPAKGVRAFDSNGRLLPDGALLAVGSLQGIRLVGFFGKAHQAELRLHLCKAGSSSPITESTHIVRSACGASRIEVRLIEYAHEITRMLAEVDGLDTTVNVRLQIGCGAPIVLRIARYACDLLKLSELPGIALLPAVYAQMALKDVENLQVRALRLDASSEEPVILEPQLTEGVATGSWILPVKDLVPGPWLVYPRIGSSLLFRPMLFPIRDPLAGMPSVVETVDLSGALRVSDPTLRVDSIDAALTVLAKNFTHADWRLIESLAGQLGHLPLATLDLWRRFARMPSAMVALAFRMGTLPTAFLERFPIELPMMWELISFHEWSAGMCTLRSQAITWFGDSEGEGMFETHLMRRVENLTTLNPSLRVLLEVAMAEATGVRPTDVASHMKHGPTYDAIHRARLFEGQDCLMQSLMRINSEAKWPDGFGSVLERARRDGSGKYLSPERHGFHDVAINMPILLAYLVATSTVTDWSREICHLRSLQTFDPDWFAAAFDLTVARCLAMQEIPILYTVSRTLSDGTKVFQRNAASVG